MSNSYKNIIETSQKNRRQNIYHIFLSKCLEKKNLDFFSINFDVNVLPDNIKSVYNFIEMKNKDKKPLPTIEEVEYEFQYLKDCLLDEEDSEKYSNDFLLGKLNTDYKRNKMLLALDEFSLSLDEGNITSACDFFRKELNLIEQFDKQKKASTSLLHNCEDALEYKPSKGFLYGLPTLDRNIGGLKNGEFVVICARPKGNKSFFARFIALNILKQGGDIFYISLETSKENELRNFIALESKIDPFLMLTGILSDQDREKAKGTISSFKEKAKTQIFEIMDATCFKKMTPSVIFSTIEPLIKNKEKTVIFIDQASWLIDDEMSNNPNQTLTNLSKSFIGYSASTGIPLVVLFQAGRDASQRIIPNSRDIQWSDRPLQDCHLALALGASPEMKRQKQKYIKTIAHRIGTETCLLADFDIEKGIMKEVIGDIDDPDELGQNKENQI